MEEFNILNYINNKNILPKDRLFFSQLSYLCKDKDLNSLFYNFIQKENIITECKDKFDFDEPADMPYSVMGSGPFTLKFIQFLIKLKQPKKILELGTFIGVSTLFFAEAMPYDGKIITIESVKKFYDIAVKNFEKNGFSEKITPILGEVSKSKQLILEHAPFDLVFIDCSKETYLESTKLYYQNLSPGGVMIIDDALFHGDVLNTFPVTHKGNGVKNSVSYITKKKDAFSFMLPIGNGMLLIYKHP